MTSCLIVGDVGDRGGVCAWTQKLFHAHETPRNQ